MTSSDFVQRYGSIYEHSPWVAERVSELLDDEDIAAKHLANLMADCVDNASTEQQLEPIRAHPDLAGKVQIAGELTQESTEEQSTAGLNRCSEDEYKAFQALNVSYKKKFGFPFVMAVRESDRVEILSAFVSRLENDYDIEFETALQEIHKIAGMRLAAMENTP